MTAIRPLAAEIAALFAAVLAAGLTAAALQDVSAIRQRAVVHGHRTLALGGTLGVDEFDDHLPYLVRYDPVGVE